MMRSTTIASTALLTLGMLHAQNLPSAPHPKAAPPPRPVPILEAAAQNPAGMPVPTIPPGTQNPATTGPVPETAGAPVATGPQLTLLQAEQMAIRNNPRISVGKLEALEQHQSYLETRAGELPNVNFAATAMDSEEASRISAGSLTASRLLPHVGAGLNFTQLIYDFGHTHNLVLSQKFSEQASNANALATTEEIVLATDQAFFNALTAQAELNVAKQTVSTRQTTQTQVGQMTEHKLKSTLDLSFANVDLSQAQLLQLDAQNNEAAAMATLDAVLGLDRSVDYQLVEKAATPPPPPPSADPLIQIALQQRPDLQALNLNAQSAQKYARAEWDQLLPSISAAGTAGTVPIRTDNYYTSSWWGGIGGNINFPVFNGFFYISQAREAKYRAQAAAENSRDLRNNIVRDVRTSWLQATTSWQRMAVTAQLVQQADLAFNLAQTRYKLGLSSIVELSQAQLQQTSAQIQDTAARYQYRLALSTLNYEIGNAP
jgi:outer membrane protein